MMRWQFCPRGGCLLKKNRSSSLLIVCLLVSLALWVEPANPAPPVQKHSSLEYNPQDVVTVAGLITAIDPAAASNLPEPVFLTLTTPQGKVKVFLGPNWYVAEQGMALALFDRLEVTGAKLIDQGKVVIFAAQIKKGNHIMRLCGSATKPAGPSGPAGNRKQNNQLQASCFFNKKQL